MLKFGSHIYKKAFRKNEKGSALVLTMATTVGFISFMYAVTQLNRNLTDQYSSAKAQLASFKSTQEIALNSLSPAYAAGTSGVCPNGTIKMSMTAVNGNLVTLCLKGQQNGNSVCVDNPLASADSSKRVCISGVGAGGTISTIPSTRSTSTSSPTLSPSATNLASATPTTCKSYRMDDGGGGDPGIKDVIINGGGVGCGQTGCTK